MLPQSVRCPGGTETKNSDYNRWLKYATLRKIKSWWIKFFILFFSFGLEIEFEPGCVLIGKVLRMDGHFYNYYIMVTVYIDCAVSCHQLSVNCQSTVNDALKH